jgi:hypothetical protein
MTPARHHPATTDPDTTAREGGFRRRRVLVTAVAGGVIAAGLVVVGIVGLVRGPDTHPPVPTLSAPATISPAPAGSSPALSVLPVPSSGLPVLPGAVLAPIPSLGAPEDFARAVATALFTWDTTTGLAPSDYAQVLVDVGNDTEIDLLAGDVRSYLPTPASWSNLRQYATRQWITINTVTVPPAWDTALAQAAPGQIPPGTTAYTITATRHRAGIWGTAPQTTTGEVAFTVFTTCTPVPERPDRKSVV